MMRLTPLVLVLMWILAAPVAAHPPDDSSAAVAGDPRLRIVFAAYDRDPHSSTFGFEHIYTADANGQDVRRITPMDGYWYDWPTWAFNGTKIVFSARRGAGDVAAEGKGIDEGIYLMDPDGSNRIRLTYNTSRNVQPKISADGHTLIFNSLWDEFPRVAVYRMDLATLRVENLSASFLPKGGRDADPRFTFDGSRVLAVSAMRDDGTDQPGQVISMTTSGTTRIQLTDDTYYNTDPSLSPDGRYLVVSSYRGEDRPLPGSDQKLERHAYDWRLVVRDLVSGEERELTQGSRACLRLIPCEPSEAVAWAPNWSPNGRQIGYVSLRGVNHSGLYVIDADGRNARPLIETPDKTITYWDWVVPGIPPIEALERIGKKASPSRLLYSARVYDYDVKVKGLPEPQLFSSTPDRFASQAIAVGSGLSPEIVRWSPDRSRIVFSARVKVDRSDARPYPTPPPGLDRTVHFTYDELNPYLLASGVPRPSNDVAELQLFVMDADGGELRQITTPWIEDYMDAIPEGDARGNTEPDISPDGRYVIFTNLSETTLQSFILRLDLETGEVVNLTNVTAGAIPVADSKPRFSPNGKRIAFSSATGTGLQVFVMNADGSGVRQVTEDDNVNVDPAWSPDGRWLAFASYRGTALLDALDEEGGVAELRIPTDDWYLAKVEVDTGAQVLLTSAEDSPAFRPVWSPEGDRVAYMSGGHSPQPDIYVVDADGGRPMALQVTLLSKEESFDWR
jgi:Tol biopolymer transport system component